MIKFLSAKIIQEIKPSMIEVMKAKQSLKAAELQDGDIVCFQKASDGRGSEPRSSESDRESVINLASQLTLTESDDSSVLSRNGHADRIEDARLYYDFLLHKRLVQFRPHPRTPNVDPFDLLLSSKQTYDQVAARVGDKLNIPPTHLKFFTVNNTSGNPKAAVKRGQTQTLQNILNPPYSSFGGGNQRPDSLYFEILDMSLAELDTKKAFKVIWLSEGITKEVSTHGQFTKISSNHVLGHYRGSRS